MLETTSSRLGLATLALLALTSAAEPRRQDPDGDAVTLTFRELEEGDLILPREAWKPVEQAIELDGFRFEVRTVGGNKLQVDTTADGKLDDRATGEGGVLALRARDESGRRFNYVVRLRNDGHGWVWSSGGSMIGRVSGRLLRLVDLDGNGRYDDYGRDAMAVGPDAGASFLSRVVNVAGELFDFAVDGRGETVTLTPYQGPRATIDVQTGFSAKAELVAAVIASGELSFNVADARVMTVPAGEYRFVSGFARGGAETVRIAPGKMPALMLEPDTETVLEWGGPLEGEFDYKIEGTQLVVSPRVNFYGRFGEEYCTFKPDARSPKVIVREVSSGKIVQSGRFGGCCGGGFSAYHGKVPAGVELVVSLEHARTMFGKILGSPRRAVPSTGR